jgi:pyruvate/2-oxoglutarate dehydrogenase complex dihydrolipoamide acyltransferase (E2) component
MVEVMTDKATVEIPSPKAGRVAKLMVPAGQLCAVGQVMVVIETAGLGAGGSCSACGSGTLLILRWRQPVLQRRL